MGIYSIKPKFQQFLSPLKNLLIKLKISPTSINFLALIISISGALALYYSYLYPLLLIWVPFMAFIRTALNALDGLVARETKAKNQEFGEVLNETLDRISDVIIFLGLSLSPLISLKLGSISIILILLNSYLSIVSKAAGGSRQYGGIVGKADRMFYLSLAAVLVLVIKDFNIFNYLFIFLIITTIITFIQRFISIKREVYK